MSKRNLVVLICKRVRFLKVASFSIRITKNKIRTSQKWCVCQCSFVKSKCETKWIYILSFIQSIITKCEFLFIIKIIKCKSSKYLKYFKVKWKNLCFWVWSFCFAIICITSSVSLYYYHYCEWWKNRCNEKRIKKLKQVIIHWIVIEIWIRFTKKFNDRKKFWSKI